MAVHWNRWIVKNGDKFNAINCDFIAPLPPDSLGMEWFSSLSWLVRARVGLIRSINSRPIMNREWSRRCSHETLYSWHLPTINQQLLQLFLRFPSTNCSIWLCLWVSNEFLMCNFLFHFPIRSWGTERVLGNVPPFSILGSWQETVLWFRQLFRYKSPPNRPISFMSVSPERPSTINTSAVAREGVISGIFWHYEECLIMT